MTNLATTPRFCDQIAHLKLARALLSVPPISSFTGIVLWRHLIAVDLDPGLAAGRSHRALLENDNPRCNSSHRIEITSRVLTQRRLELRRSSLCHC
jgi:hypothetical protein